MYGYRNVGDPKQRRREIVPKEAAVVKRIFELSADGRGLLKIVKILNGEKIPSPTGRGWATTGVREMLKRDLYRGISVYGKTRWEWRDGGKFKVAVPGKEWRRVPAPELRIISDKLWKAVQDRQELTRETFPGRGKRGELQGRREAGLVSQYLLSGFLRCSCGGNLTVITRPGRGGVKRYWVCTVSHHRGKDICPNGRGIPYEELTAAVITTFNETIFHPKALAIMVQEELRRRAEEPDAVKAEIEGLRRDLAKLEQEIARGVECIFEGTAGDVKALGQALKGKEREKDVITAKLEHLDGIQKAAEGFDLAEWMHEQTELLDQIKTHMSRGSLPPEEATADQRSRFAEGARRILRVCLPAPLVVSPDPDGGWTFKGQGRFIEQGIREVLGRINPTQNPESQKMVPPG